MWTMWQMVRIHLVVCMLAAVVMFNFTARCGWTYTEEEAPVRMLLVGDPQIEGSDRLEREGLWGMVAMTLDDWYMRFVSWRTQAALGPAHVVVMGDGMSRQHLAQEEFESRADRLEWMFGKAEAGQDERAVAGEGHAVWHLVGNHDVGYGHELRGEEMRRWEGRFGRSNGMVELDGHRVVFVNAMLVDGRAGDEEEQEATWAHLRAVAKAQAEEEKPLVLLTHIPLYREVGKDGACGEEAHVAMDALGRVIRQNTLSAEKSAWLLQHLRPRWVLSGHDHEGCVHTHPLPTKNGGVGMADVAPTHATEITVRSIMGDYGGGVHLFEFGSATQASAHAQCPFVTIHWVVGLICYALLIYFDAALLWALEIFASGGGKLKRE